MLATILTLINHLLPVLITLLGIAVAFVTYKFTPLLHYVALVASAHDEEGVTKLAKYIAHKTGGPRIHVGRAWDQFVPAAQKIAEVHQERVNTVVSKS